MDDATSSTPEETIKKVKSALVKFKSWFEENYSQERLYLNIDIEEDSERIEPAPSDTFEAYNYNFLRITIEIKKKKRKVAPNVKKEWEI